MALARARMGRFTSRACIPALLLLAGGCQVERNPLNVYTNTGQNLGVRAYQEITPHDSKVSFVGDDPTKRREAQSLPDRYSERITLKNNMMMHYSKTFGGLGFTGAWTDIDDLQADIQNSVFYKDHGI